MINQERLLEFLHGQLAIPPESIELGLRRTVEVPHLLPIVLYQYGLVTIRQLDQIFSWLEAAAITSIGNPGSSLLTSETQSTA